jgi:zona occludens toxin (predicted ATPase)
MHVIVILSESALTSVQAMMSIMLHEKSTKKGFEKYLKTEYECHTWSKTWRRLRNIEWDIIHTTNEVGGACSKSYGMLCDN